VAITKAGRKYHHDHINGKKPAKCITNFSPTVIPLNGCRVKPSVLQIWTSDKKVHQFIGFAGHFDMIFDKLSQNWKSIHIHE